MDPHAFSLGLFTLTALLFSCSYAQAQAARVVDAQQVLDGREAAPDPPEKVSGCKLSVVGAGIGGVYFAYRLVQDAQVVAAEDVCVFEASAKRVGGRIYSVRNLPSDEKLVVDMGGYRFVPTQKIITELVGTRLGLKSRCYYPVTCEDSRRVITDETGLDNLGFVAPIEVMMRELVEGGARVFYGYRLTSISDLSWEDLKLHSGAGGRRPVELKFENGGSAISEQVMLNIPSESIAQLHQLSLLFTKGGALGRQVCAVPLTKSSTKVYAEYRDAWWITKLGLGEGSFSDQSNPRLVGRYHDGHVRCFNGDGQLVNVGEVLEKGGNCNGLLLVAYFGSGDPLREKYYTQFQATDDPLTIVRNSEEDERFELLQAVHTKLMEYHKEELNAAGFNVSDIDMPENIYMANWKEENTLTGSIHDWPKYLPGTDYIDVTKSLMRPIPGYDVFVANEAYGISSGWAEGSLIMAERALAFEMGIPKPWWLEDSYYETSVLDLSYFDMDTVQLFEHNFPQSAPKVW